MESNAHTAGLQWGHVFEFAPGLIALEFAKCDPTIGTGVTSRGVNKWPAFDFGPN